MVPMNCNNAIGLEHGPALVRALRSLTTGDFDLLRQRIGTGSGWSVYSFDDYDGYRMILVEPTAEQDAAPSYLISGRTGAIGLTCIQDDQIASLGRFDRMHDLIDALAQRTECSPR